MGGQAFFARFKQVFPGGQSGSSFGPGVHCERELIDLKPVSLLTWLGKP
jgi:hypothetical protein